MAMNYRLGRWYDPYPRLAFAFQMLDFAPAAIRQQSISKLRQVLMECFDESSSAVISQPEQGKGHRWYDQFEGEDVSCLMGMLKSSPDSVKDRAADTLLGVLQHDL
jgi:hypothetical protein